MLSLVQNPYSPERWSAVRVVFQLVDVDAAEDATPTATSEAEISKLEQTHNRVFETDKKLATLEHNYFLLDGSHVLPDETDNGEVGWWSGEISDSNGNFSIPQVLEFVFSEPQSSIGFTVIFDDKAEEYASNFKIEVFDASDVLLAEDNVVDNTSAHYISETPVDSYRRVKITFFKTAMPFRRVRVCEVIFGIVQVFSGKDVTQLKLLQQVSVGMESLPSNELTVTLENLSRRYNMANPQGIYKYLQDGQPLDVKIGVGESQNSIEYVNAGRYYYTSSKAQDSSMTAQIIANDWLYFLEGKCQVGTTGTWTVDEAVAAVIADSGLPITTNIPSSIGNRVINKCIPQDTTHREALRMIAQASMSACFFNREHELEFVDLALGDVVDELGNSNLYEPAEISVSDPINTVKITVRDEYAQTETVYTATNKKLDETEKVKLINNPLVANQDVAEWLLSVYQKRIYYDLRERGNPAREIADTVRIYDVYGENRNAIITKQEYIYDGALRANSEAWGGGI